MQSTDPAKACLAGAARPLDIPGEIAPTDRAATFRSSRARSRCATHPALHELLYARRRARMKTLGAQAAPASGVPVRPRSVAPRDSRARPAGLLLCLPGAESFCSARAGSHEEHRPLFQSVDVQPT